MQIDLQDLQATAQPYRAQVCIAGAGVAGLFLATRLAVQGIDVHLLEAGGLTLEDRSQQIYNAQMPAATHLGTTEGRFRTFGGSSVRWGAQLLPYTQDIFQPPAGLPSGRWPLTPDQFERFYPEIEDGVHADHLPFTMDLYRSLGLQPPAGFEGHPGILLRFSKWAPFAYRNLTGTLGKQAQEHGKITVFLHANLAEVKVSSDGSRVEYLEARNYSGASFRFEATRYVLALGTIETSRILLASRSVQPNGAGNQNDQVGRGFHDHISVGAAVLDGEARSKALEWFAPFLIDGTTHTAKLEANVNLRERLGLLAVMAHITLEEPEDSGAGVLRAVLRSMQRGDLKSALLKSLPKLPGASIDIARFAYAMKVKKRRAVSSRAEVTLRLDTEQRARPENRIRVSDTEKDALGLPKTIVDWRISPDEEETLRRYAAYLRDELPRLGFGKVAWRPEFFSGESISGILDTYHPMGGLLMGTDPASSVVDSDLRMHSLPNLSIASAAVFPAGGSSNPTFTLIALTMRLAERLAAEV